MKISVEKKAKTIYSHFSKAPILEMVQYLVNENVDAQVLHQLKLIDQKTHKNPYVTSYGEKVYSSYERICKVLVTYPSLEFKESKFNIIKDKEHQFAQEYFGRSEENITILNEILKILNQCLMYGVESVSDSLKEMKAHLQSSSNFIQLNTFLKEACGEDYKTYIKKCISN
tara:strand:- start:4852 stop:5364 length:513 start_codon:yes stop_codon:yes gene_type:complete